MADGAPDPELVPEWCVEIQFDWEGAERHIMWTAPELVQIDAVHPDSSDHSYRHFSARDVVSRWDVLAVYSRETAATARDILDAVI